MSSELLELPLKSLCLLVVDCPHSTPVWTDYGVVVLRNQNIKGGRLDLSNPSFTDEDHYLGRTKRAIPQENDLVITREAPMGEVCRLPAGLKCCLGQRQVLLRPDPDKVDSGYLLYALQSPYLQWQIGWSEGTGSTVSNLRIPVLEQLNVPVPPLTTQREVAQTLGVLDERITLLREINKTLESIAQAIFKSWFVDFDPVRAKMGGRQPEGMDEETAALFPDSFEHFANGSVPRGWSLQRLSEAYEINPFRKLKKGDSSKYLDMANVPVAGFSIGDIITRSFSSGSKFSNRDTLLARITPCLENGKTAYVDFLDEGEVAWGSTEFIVLRPKGPLPQFHAYLLCRSPSFREHAIKSMSGTSGRQRVQNDMLGAFLIAVPTLDIAQKFADVCEAIQVRCTDNQAKSKTLAALRDTLLPRLISGKLRQPEAQEQVENALS